MSRVLRADQRLSVLAISAVGVQSSIMAMDRCCCSSLPLSYQRESFSTCKFYCEYPVMPCVCDFCDQHANHLRSALQLICVSRRTICGGVFDFGLIDIL